MNRVALQRALLIVSPALVAGCSGMGTMMTKMDRLGQNKGYEIAAELPVVQQAAMSVLRARGYDVSVKADPEDGAEGAGQIVIGQKTQHYSASDVGDGSTGSGSPVAMDTRKLVDIYVSKKWQMGSDLGEPNVTLVVIVGGDYLRREPNAEVESPLGDDFIARLRDELERAVDASRLIPAKVPGT